MPLVNVMVNARAYTIACDEGEQEHLKELAAHVDVKVRELTGSVGQVGDQKLLLMAAVLITDEFFEARTRVDGHAKTAKEFTSAKTDLDKRIADAEKRAAAAIKDAEANTTRAVEAAEKHATEVEKRAALAIEDAEKRIADAEARLAEMMRDAESKITHVSAEAEERAAIEIEEAAERLERIVEKLKAA
jgi:cell division protein ZapA